MLKNLILENFQKKYSSETLEKVQAYYELLMNGNKTQNLTRITSEEDFFYHNFLDCHHLGVSGFILEKTTLTDIGSGCGVPGILSAILFPETQWVLSESEKRKAEFLSDTVQKLDLQGRVLVSNERAERFLKNKKYASKKFQLTMRALGSMVKINSLFRNCSTWNNMVLFKGPKWTTEWSEYLEKNRTPNLKILKTYEYSALDKKRILIHLEKVPRGTKEKV